MLIRPNAYRRNDVDALFILKNLEFLLQAFRILLKTFLAPTHGFMENRPQKTSTRKLTRLVYEPDSAE